MSKRMTGTYANNQLILGNSNKWDFDCVIEQRNGAPEGVTVIAAIKSPDMYLCWCNISDQLYWANDLYADVVADLVSII